MSEMRAERPHKPWRGPDPPRMRAARRVARIWSGHRPGGSGSDAMATMKPGNRLIIAAAAEGKTQEQIASRLEVPQQTVSLVLTKNGDAAVAGKPELPRLHESEEGEEEDGEKQDTSLLFALLDAAKRSRRRQQRAQSAGGKPSWFAATKRR
jgi:hypothetical protein